MCATTKTVRLCYFCIFSATTSHRLRGVGIATRVNGAAPRDIPLSDINLGSWEFWSLDDDIRDGTFATLRRERPISFQQSYISNGVSPVNGHWALTTHDDVFYASRHPEIFSSALGITIG